MKKTTTKRTTRLIRLTALSCLLSLLASCTGVSAPPPTVVPRAPSVTQALAPTVITTPAPTAAFMPAATQTVLRPSATLAVTATTAAPVSASARPTLTPDARPGLDTPKWFNDATMYQIFVRSFRDSNGDGIGDLNGIREQLDYVQSLGANTIWLTPHYPSTTYHGYDVVDYKAVNPEFGTLDDFKALTAEMKKRGMHLFVDFVANHSSSAHPFFKDAYKNPASKYTTWYHFRDAKNETYDSFAGVKELPEWNHDNPDVNTYLIDSALFWLDAGADGLRCDYAKNISADFWQALRQAVKAKYPRRRDLR